MNDTKMILLIGRSGRGKSTLANVITNTSDFKESSSSVSETKKIQVGEFVENDFDYQIIDTPGIGDTKMSDNEVLDVIAEAVYLARNGISQVFFITNGRFDQYEMATYDLLRTIIFDSDVTKYTTIVRTRFDKFKKKEACQVDIDLMVKEAKEKRAELEQSIFIKEEKLTNLSSTEVKYQELSAEIEKAKKELAATNLAEIIESCQGRVVYVNNPSLEVEDKDEFELNKGKRDKSRKILLKHLNDSCQEKLYNPPSLKKLSDDIADDYFQYLKKKEELQKELDEEMERLNSRGKASAASQTSSSQFSGVDISNQTELIAEEKEDQAKIEENIMIIEKEKYEKMIAELQDKKERLQKEIVEKEKIIHQKVLKHIFNNYEAINKELGGDVFLNSVAGDYPWPEIHSEFSNKELIVKWLSQGFDYQQTKDWATALIDFDPQLDADFCVWLRDKKQLTTEEIKRQSYPQNIERWRKEYAFYLGRETELLAKHNEQLDQGKNWEDVHEDFSQTWFGRSYQQIWEKSGITCQEAKEWIRIGFRPRDYSAVKGWREQGFTTAEVKIWIETGLKIDEHKLASQLKKNIRTGSDFNLREIRKEFATWLDNLKEDAQVYLDKKYSLNERKQITELDIRGMYLTGSLKLTGFSNLGVFYCSGNQLTELDLSDCVSLSILYCSSNQLTSLNFLSSLSPTKLKELSIHSNNFFCNDLSVFSNFVNLERLWIGSLEKQSKTGQDYDRWVGSLRSFQFLNKLKELYVWNTDVDSGLEYLPENLKNFGCQGTKFAKELEAYGQPDFSDYIQLLANWRRVKENQQTQILQPANSPPKK